MYNIWVNTLDFSNIKAVAFNIDGTLYRTWKFNIRMPVYFFSNSLFFLKYGLVRNIMRRTDAVEDLGILQSELMAKKLHCTPEEAKAKLEKIVYKGLESKFEHIKPCSGSIEFIKHLKEKGYKIGILSDFPPEQKGDIWGIKDICDVVLGSEQTGALKPDPTPFLKLAEKLGLAPEEILYVGNSHRYDIAGSKKTGMKAAWLVSCLSGIFGKKSKLADVTFWNFKMLEKIFFENVKHESE